MQINKKELRGNLLERRRNMDKNSKQENDVMIYNNIISLPQIHSAGNFLCYISTDIEVDTRQLITKLISDGKKVYAPRCKGKEMRFFRITDFAELKTGAFGIPEPTGSEEPEDFSASFCIVPALSFDENGYRLGYGGGYYDRFLHDYDGISVGICYDDFLGEVPREEHDLPVDILVTETKILSKN